MTLPVSNDGWSPWYDIIPLGAEGTKILLKIMKWILCFVVAFVTVEHALCFHRVSWLFLFVSWCLLRAQLVVSFLRRLRLPRTSVSTHRELLPEVTIQIASWSIHRILMRDEYPLQSSIYAHSLMPSPLEKCERSASHTIKNFTKPRKSPKRAQ